VVETPAFRKSVSGPVSGFVVASITADDILSAPPITPKKIRPHIVLRCTSFASPPIPAEVMKPENAVIDPEKIAVLRRELVR